MRSQIVIPVHDSARPIARAASSVLADPASGVVVVAHNIDPAKLDLPDDRRITVVRVAGDDGRPGAAFDAGIAVATAEWVGIMGSDDWFEPGALQMLRERAETDRADGVCAPLAYQGGGRGFAPKTLRHQKLEAARDRLFYRTAPLGLFRRELMQRPEYRFGSEFPVGEDFAVSVRLWSSGHAISYYPDDPAYVVGSDAKERTTLRPRPLSEHGAAWLGIWDRPWVSLLDPRTRHALAVKTLRVHVWGAVAARSAPSDWRDGDFEWLSGLTRRVLSEDPRVLGSFRKASVRTLRAVADGDFAATLASYAAERTAGLAQLMLTDHPATMFEREAPLRTTAITVVHWIRTRLRRLTRRRTTSGGAGGTDGTRPGDRPKVLIFSFSPIVNDARVLKQVNLLKDRFRVVTCGFGEAPEGVVEHIELPSALLPTALDGRLITLKAYRLAYWRVPAISGAWRILRGRRFDVILANDIETVPIALRLQPAQGVHADLHEHYPSMHDYQIAWKRRISPYLSWLCSRYATRASSTSTVSSGLQRAFSEQFGFSPTVVPNATPYAELEPTPVGSPIRLVHSGAGLRNRRLEVMLEAVRDSRAEVTFDLFLTLNEPAYLEELREQFGEDPRITFHDPVPYSQLVRTLNAYDVGVFVLPPLTFSYEWALPNKLFDFVQARLGVIVGPSPEMAAIVHEHEVGVVVDGFAVSDLARSLDQLTREAVVEAKRRSGLAAHELSAAPQNARWRAAIEAMTG